MRKTYTWSLILLTSLVTTWAKKNQYSAQILKLEKKTDTVIDLLESKFLEISSKITDTCRADCDCPSGGTSGGLIQKLREMATREQLLAAANANETISQWVQSVTQFSSEYNTNTWSASQVIGEPNVYPRYGDLQGSWATSVRDANQFIEVQFQRPVFITRIDIYETYNAGGVRSVKARDSAGNWVTLWQTASATHIQSSRIFSPELQAFPTKTANIRIEIDCTASGGSWVELDAVNLIGRLSQDGVGEEGSLTYRLRKMASPENLLEAAQFGTD